MKLATRLLLTALLLGLPLSGFAEPKGYIQFEDNAVWKPLTQLPARKGDGAPDIIVTDVLSSRTLKLSEFKGQVLYLEFWATWCHACIPLMDKYDRIAGEQKDAWAGKVVIAAISLDKDPRYPKRAAEGNGWKFVRQLWSPMDMSGREALASKAFGIIDLPYAVLIDMKGQIIWRGDPSRYPMEDQINSVLGLSPAP